MMSKILNCWRTCTDVSRQPATAALVLTAIAVVAPAAALAQISTTAYRALGQPDLAKNGVNRVQGIELNGPSGIAVDTRGGQTRVYIADTLNHRVLGWPDAQSYQEGNPPAVVLGQPSMESSVAMGVGTSGFRTPTGLAVDSLTGALYVADTGNHRVLRFADPFANFGRVDPEAVYGQADLSGTQPNGSDNPRNALREPLAVAVDGGGNLWIADSGNHRVLRYPAAALNSSMPAADAVIGQRSFTENERNRSGAVVTGAGFDTPAGLVFVEGALYVSDSGNMRVLRFQPPFGPESGATTAIAMPAGRTASPRGISAAGGQIYVAIPRESRVLVFGGSSTSPVTVFGQTDLNGRDPNAGSHPRASAFSLFEAADVKVDAAGDVYVADTGNHRVLRFASGSRSADRLWGQIDYSSNSVNQVKPGSLNGPFKVAIDYSQAPYALYVSDTRNHRILVWNDAVKFRTGDPADSVIGQASFREGIVNFEGDFRRLTARSLSSPKGIAVDAYGNLYVADSGNHRVLRFPRPVQQSSPPAADLVLGQPDYTSGTAAITSASTLRSPSAVAIGPDGSVFVSDTGNSRVLEYAPESFTGASAIRVYGQPNFSSSVAPRVVSAQTLTSPGGIAVDAGFNLYIADTGANRVVIHANTRDAATSSNAAAVVIGSDRFNGIASGSGPSRLNSPSDVALDSFGRIYVADTRNHRIAIFPSLVFLPVTDGSAMAVAGQPDLAGNAGNWNSRDGLATSESLLEPAGIFIDRRDTLYAADTGNHRVMHFLKAARFSHAVFPQASALGRGALVSVTGSELAETEESAQAPLPSSLAGREVVVNDTLAAPLASVSYGQIQLQLPSNAPAGAPRIAVRVAETGELIAGSTVAVASYAPGLYARVLNQDGASNSDTVPAVRGTTVRVLGTGQGPVSPAQPDGEAAAEGSVRTVAVPTSDGNACLTRQPSVCVAIGNTFGEVRFSGLAAGLVGVWQLDIRIPENAPTGNAVPLRAVINAVPSNIVSIAIR